MLYALIRGKEILFSWLRNKLANPFGNTSNDVVLMVIHKETAAKAFTYQFERMWNDTRVLKQYKIINALFPLGLRAVLFQDLLKTSR
jgi:hypothetical protein